MNETMPREAEQHNSLITTLITPRQPADVDALLNPLVKQWFSSKFPSFSLSQLYGVLPIHERSNILISAPTGATKTLTAFLAILNELVDSAQKGALEDKIYCVYISPLKALNNDIQKNLKEPLHEMEQIAGKDLGIRIGVRTGDTTTSERAKMLKHSPHILITTPESLAILLASPKFCEKLKAVDWCIVDEIHALADNKRGVHLSLCMEYLQSLSGHTCRVGLSATIAPVEDVARFLVGNNRPCQIAEVQFMKQYDLKVISPVRDLVDTDHPTMQAKLYELLDNLIQSHKTTLIFTNTRAATERVVDHLKQKFPKNYLENIGAHHGSLSKEHRTRIEQQLRDGKLRCVVCSTSLELGIDIGYIDLVVCMSSPKSVARFLQRVGRSGHCLHQTVKGRLLAMDRDDLVECAVLLKAAMEKKIDRLHIPTNCLDILAQIIYGLSMTKVWEEKEILTLVRGSYCYKDLSTKDFEDVLQYLAGTYAELEDRHIYAKIWREGGKLGRRGKLGRVIYMTNLGTIPDETFVTVKVGEQTIGMIDEGFLEKMKPGDVFVLGGDTYQFKFSRGMVAQVTATSNRPPTVPRWVSESLPLSFDLALEIGRFRRLLLDRIAAGEQKQKVIEWLKEHLYADDNAASAIYDYFVEQYAYAKHVPTDKTILIEHVQDDHGYKAVVHSLYGRRVNDCLSRAVAFILTKQYQSDVEISINDNGFSLSAAKQLQIIPAFKMLKADKIDFLMKLALDSSEVMKRRFRHCAGRALMILRNYMGRTKHVGRQQVSSMILMSALKRIDPDFSILKEARREVLEDLMDVKHTKEVVQLIENGRVRLVEIQTRIPSPFAFNLALQGYMDVLKMEDRVEFLRRMHQLVLAKIGTKESAEKIKEPVRSFDYADFWNEKEKEREEEKNTAEFMLKQQAWALKHVPKFVKMELIRLIDGEKNVREDFIAGIEKYNDEIEKTWPKELKEFVMKKVKELG